MRRLVRSVFFRISLSAFLSYTLVIPLCTPFVQTATAEGKSLKLGTTNAIATQESSQTAPMRGGELLVRFRESVPEQDRANALAAHGSRRKKQLRGQSGIEKLELTAGQDVETAAIQLRLNPAVEFAEPNFLIKPDELRSSWTYGKTPIGQVHPSEPRPGVLNPPRTASVLESTIQYPVRRFP